MDKKIVMLVGKGNSAKYMYNALKEKYEITNIIIEKPVNKKVFIRKRIKRIGFLKVFGQILFQTLYVPILKRQSKKRIAELIKEYRLDNSNFEKSKAFYVPSVNSNICLEKLKSIKPDLIIVNGTRIISKKILRNIKSTFINTHVGITPKYRGVHGGYWAISNNDEENYGVTVHLIDEGIDTGDILYQKRILKKKTDNFTTYTYAQIGEGIELMKKAIDHYLDNDLKTINSNTKESIIWTHPTIWFYLYNRLFNGIK